MRRRDEAQQARNRMQIHVFRNGYLSGSPPSTTIGRRIRSKVKRNMVVLEEPPQAMPGIDLRAFRLRQALTRRHKPPAAAKTNVEGSGTTCSAATWYTETSP